MLNHMAFTILKYETFSVLPSNLPNHAKHSNTSWVFNSWIMFFLLHLVTHWLCSPQNGWNFLLHPASVEAYIDTVLSSKDFLTSAQNAHGFMMADNGKVGEHIRA